MHTSRVARATTSDGDAQAISYGKIHQRVVERYAPPSMLVSPDFKVVHLSETAGRFLVHPGGEVTASAFKLVREELRGELGAALHGARERQATTRSMAVPLEIEGESVRVVMDVRPAGNEDDGFILVIFDERASVETEPSEGAPGSGAASAGLEAELDVTRQRLQAMIEEFETSREEMKASHEELQSSNEELRSTLEELETSKEELQSMNEELQTVNQENRHKVEELAQLTGDLQNLMAATDIATLFLDRNLRILRYTPRVGELFSVREVDRGRPLSDLTHRLGYDELTRDAEAVLDRLIPVEREVRDEAGRWYLARVLPYRSGRRVIEGVVITLIDITERKRAEEALRLEEERYRALVEASAQIVWTTDVSGRVVEDSPSWRAFTGQSTEQWRGTGWANAVHPDDREEAVRAWERSVEGERPFDTQFRLRHAPSGSWRWTHVRAVPLRAPDGAVRGWVGMNSDVTERHEAEEVLREREARFRAAADLVPDLLWETDSAGRATWFNRRGLRYTGRTFDESLGSGWLDSLHDDDRPQFERVLSAALSGGNALREECRVRGGDGEYRYFLIQVRPVPADNGSAARWFGSATDIHEQRMALESAEAARIGAEKADRAKSEFLAVMSHELRTPLTGVIGYSDLLESEVLGPVSARQKEPLSRIRNNALHLVSIIDEILTISRSGAGHEEMHFEEIDIAELGRAAVAMFERAASARGLMLRVDDGDAPLPMRTDAGKVRQILVNLIGNAVKYTDEGEVRVRLDRDETDWILIHVRDTGPGISAADRERIFEPFTQVDSSYSRRGSGVGLGLAICNRMARLLGGTVELDSAPGAGSTFTLRLPRGPAINSAGA